MYINFNAIHQYAAMASLQNKTYVICRVGWLNELPVVSPPYPLASYPIGTFGGCKLKRVRGLFPGLGG